LNFILSVCESFTGVKMLIANPIYDVVFKRLMENERVAKFFISTLIGKEIQSIEVLPQEFTYSDRATGISIFRLDFVANVKTDTGDYQKILIEIQKAKSYIDIIRFRSYLGEQYKKEDKIDGKNTILPITTIYILGFTLPEIDSACIHVERQYKDLIENTVIDTRCDFIERLTHDSYIVQVNRITSRYQTSLDKLLSIFEQANFDGDNKTVKIFPYNTDIEEVEIMTKILHHAGTNPEERKEIEIEAEAWRSINAMFAETEQKYLKQMQDQQQIIYKKDESLKAKEEALKEKDEAIKEKDAVLKTKDEALKAKEEALKSKEDEIAMLKKMLENK